MKRTNSTELLKQAEIRFQAMYCTMLRSLPPSVTFADSLEALLSIKAWPGGTKVATLKNIFIDHSKTLCNG